MSAQLIIACAIIRNDQGELLLARRNQPDIPTTHGKWEFLGGGIEFGESPQQALIREVKEEGSVDVKITEIFPEILQEVVEHGNGPVQIFMIHYYCQVISGELKPGDKEIAELKFVPLAEVTNYDIFDNVREVAEYLSRHHA